MMRRREFITLIGGAAAWPLPVRAQQERYGASACSCPQQQTMRNFKLASRRFWRACSNRVGPSAKTCRLTAAGRTTNAVEIRSHAAELAALAPDAILTASSPALAALQQATRTVPIVFVNVIDPVGSGFVDSLARPGGNTTGFCCSNTV